MAEFIIKIGDSPSYKEGDILCAFNDKRIKQVHAEHICDYKKQPFNSDGLNTDGIHRQFLELVYQYRFDRVSQKSVIRTNLWTGEQDLLSDMPNTKGEQIKADLYIKRRTAHQNHRIFGAKGREYWYGGKTNQSLQAIDSVWAMIEAETQERKENYTLWPLTDREKAAHVALNVEDFGDSQSVSFVEDVRDTEGEIIEKRACRLLLSNIPEISGDTLARHRDRGQIVDNRRGTQPIPVSRVERKPWLP